MIVLMRYASEIRRSLRLMAELTKIGECKKWLIRKRKLPSYIRTEKIGILGLGLIPILKFRVRFRSGTAMSLSEKNVMVYYTILAYFKEWEWTANHALGTDPNCLVPILSNMASTRQKSTNLFSGWLRLAALSFITVTDFEHGTLRQIRTKRWNCFIWNGSLRTLPSNKALCKTWENSMKLLQLRSRKALAMLTAADMFKRHWKKEGKDGNVRMWRSVGNMEQRDAEDWGESLMLRDLVSACWKIADSKKTDIIKGSSNM